MCMHHSQEHTNHVGIKNSYILSVTLPKFVQTHFILLIFGSSN